MNEGAGGPGNTGKMTRINDFNGFPVSYDGPPQARNAVFRPRGIRILPADQQPEPQGVCGGTEAAQCRSGAAPRACCIAARPDPPADGPGRAPGWPRRRVASCCDFDTPAPCPHRAPGCRPARRKPVRFVLKSPMLGALPSKVQARHEIRDARTAAGARARTPARAPTFQEDFR